MHAALNHTARGAENNRKPLLGSPVHNDMKAQIARLAAVTAVEPEEKVLAGRVCAALWALGGLTGALLAVLPGLTHHHRGWVFLLAGLATGFACVLAFGTPWARTSSALIHLAVSAGFAVIAALVAASGGSRSPAWIYLFFVAMFASYFFDPRVAILYLAGCVLTEAAPMLYDSRWKNGEYVGTLVIAGPACLAFGTTVMLGKSLMRKHRARSELLAAEQGALRRVAMAVIEGADADTVFALVAAETAALLGAGAAGILRFDEGELATVVGSWADHPGGNYAPGTIIPVRPGSDVARARGERVAVRIEGHPPGSPVAKLGYSSSIVSPVIVGGRTWGALAAAGERLRASDERKLLDFGELLARAIASIDERRLLSTQASTDPLTGLANRRALHDRLSAEVSRAQRHGRTLAVAVVDIDHFKQINDLGGHGAGDARLVEVARCLSEHARAEDTLARLGGDEFAWVMPETTREQALVAVERVRRVIAAAARRHRLTVSAGICDTTATAHPAELISFADGALYWSKAHGRNRCWIYDPQLIGELSQPLDAEALERSHAVLALRALARAIDAKDPGTREHSERVADLVTRLARHAGWPPERSMLLREAALMHDVGKIGVPDHVLTKLGPLSTGERRQVNEHAELTARIVEGVLETEQVDWIRAHHERPDGSGYPLGLQEAEIPDGAALLAVADAWDVMTRGRAYSAPKPVQAALQECAELVGRQFTRAAVGALLKLHANGELDHPTSAADPDGGRAEPDQVP